MQNSCFSSLVAITKKCSCKKSILEIRSKFTGKGFVGKGFAIHISAWVLSCKHTMYFQNIFFIETFLGDCSQSWVFCLKCVWPGFLSLKERKFFQSSTLSNLANPFFNYRYVRVQLLTPSIFPYWFVAKPTTPPPPLILLHKS